jgi:4-hydroxy-tetrahydrodipicolinate reductase
MKIAIIGYGKMGKAIEKIAKERGHDIALIVDESSIDKLENLGIPIDVAIEFSTPTSAPDNIIKCLDRQLPVVVGTTGWLDQLESIKSYVQKVNGTLFLASNFSLGVNLFFKLNQWLAKMMNKYPEYKASIEEIHHIHKLDQPSGTAITLGEGIIQEHEGYHQWVNDSTDQKDMLPIHSLRKEEVPGTHTISYTSVMDSITLTHEAKDRAAFALGAVLVAEWLHGKVGIYSMDDFLTF